jgi:hypothetical protein
VILDCGHSICAKCALLLEGHAIVQSKTGFVNKPSSAACAVNAPGDSSCLSLCLLLGCLCHCDNSFDGSLYNISSITRWANSDSRAVNGAEPQRSQPKEKGKRARAATVATPVQVVPSSMEVKVAAPVATATEVISISCPTCSSLTRLPNGASALPPNRDFRASLAKLAAGTCTSILWFDRNSHNTKRSMSYMPNRCS